MKYALVFAPLGIYLCLLGGALGGAAWLLVWVGLSFLLVGGAYLGLGPGVFGKRPKGDLSFWAIGLLLPYLAMIWLVWHLLRWLTTEPCCNEVAPGIWVGRRPLAWELPPEVDLVVDLMAELPASYAVRNGRTYICLPTLDATAPDEDAFRRLVERLADWPGKVYIHCASGHGRSATLAAALLIARGCSETAAQAEEFLRRGRPGIRLKRGQRKLVQKLAESRARQPLTGPQA